MDIFKLFIHKLKVLIIVFLAAIIVGASFGFIKTSDVNYFGTTIAFYVNPQKDENSDQESEYSIYGSYGENVMDNMVKLLSSELFAETLMLDLEGLPSSEMVEKVRTSKGDEVANALAAKIADARQSLRDIEAKEAVLENKTSVLTTAKNIMYAKQTEVNNAWAALGQTGTPSRITSPLTKDDHDYNALWDAYQTALIEYNIALDDQSNARADLKEAKKLQKEKFDDTLTQWRLDYNEYYSSELIKYRNAASYSYKSPSDGSDLNFARSFFYVNISIVNDVDFAKLFRNKIVEYVPEFIETIMPIPGGYLATNCQRITRNDYIVNTNAGYAKNTAIKYAILLAVISLVVTCIVLVIIDRSDKRLRSVEQITEKFNIPVLGVIPSIVTGKEKTDKEDEN